MNQNHLFSSDRLSDVLRNHASSVQAKIDDVPHRNFAASSDDQLFDHVISDLTVNALTINEAGMTQSSDEVQIDGYSVFRDRLKMPGIRVTITIPFTGDALLWRCQPSTFTSVVPFGRVDERSGELSYYVEQPVNDSSDTIRVEYERNLNLIKEHLAWQKNDIDKVNAEIPNHIRRAIKNRRERLEKQGGIVDRLGIPLKRREGVPDAKPVIIEKRVIPPLPTAPASRPQPEWEISNQQFDYILSIIRHEGATCESTPKTYQGFDETDYRNNLLAHLNGHFEGGATGETFRGAGKTDIRLEIESRAAFVAECKMWRGPHELAEAIDQMLGYLTWRDSKSAIIIFNKDNAKFSEVLIKVPETVRSHPRFYQQIELNKGGEWRFVLTSPNDEAKHIITQVFAFNVYSPKKKAISKTPRK